MHTERSAVGVWRRWTARALPLVLVGLVLLGPLSARAGYIFRWVDAQGNLHVTDRLYDVPEPYFSMYQALLKKQAEKARKAKTKQPPAAPATPQPPPLPPKPAATPPPYPSIVEQQIQRRKQWRDLVAHWRAVLAYATRDLDAAQEQLDQARINPILRELPRQRAKIQQLQAKVAVAQARVAKARRMLLEELPARARKEHVPPGWLQ